MKKETHNEIIKDHVEWKQYTRMNYATSCEDCTHFDLHTEVCTFGYPTTPHLKRNQQENIKTSSHMAFCRTMEID